jgi:hypothetical protein
MSLDEVAARARQELGKRMDGARARTRFDFSEAPRAASAQPRFFFDAEDGPGILSQIKQRLPGEYNQILPRAERICAHRFDLLGYRDLDYGKQIDWSLDRVHGKRAPGRLFYKIGYLSFEDCGDVKVTWELNRHQHFLTLAKAYRISGEERFADEILAQWQHWNRGNPYPYGVNWASSLEYAFRALSWLWTYYLLGDCAKRRAGLREQFLRGLSVHGRAIERYLSTYFSPNTHLLGEAVALFFIGVLCPELPSAGRWKNAGWRITLEQAERQVRSDGFHFEQSLYYHVYAIDFFLHARILASRNAIAIPLEYDLALERMLDGLAVLGLTGYVPRIGDDDGGRLFDGQRNRTEHMLDPLATAAVLYQRGDFKAVARGLREETLWLLGSAAGSAFDNIPAQQPANKSVAFAQSGLHVMNASGRQIVIDAGPLGAGSGGHGHADALSLWVSDQAGPIFIDSGTLEYVGDGPERNRYRSTAAHNTLTIGDVGQPEPRAPFTWSHHPKSVVERWVQGEHFDLFIGTQDAYARLSSPVMHRRFVFSRKSDFWLVRDALEGTGEHKLDIYWHLAPGFAARGTRWSRASGSELHVITPEGTHWSQEVEAGSWSPAYGEAQEAPVLHFGTVASLPAEFATLFRSTASAGAPPGVLKIAKSSGACGYSYLQGEAEHMFLFASGTQQWALNGWSSDAEFVYWEHDRQRDRALLIFCAGTRVSMGGQVIAESPKPVCSCEVVWEDGRVTVLEPAGGQLAVDEPGFRSLMAEPVLSSSTRQQTSG